ncbi:unnamed protein product [Caenorhabditis bovis]|uniref:Serine/threonine-protein phosphatase 4 regulatory subunit 1 n=1 Tax=Caenorhabditis bovis TaxID=2654633 RepID=A0A8S1F1U5_9PELO|nr:unnamed protein product [Caenorhabditis bovis]
MCADSRDAHITASFDTLCLATKSLTDRDWIFENFVPKFSQFFQDPAMHVRKSVTQIFGRLGNMFGRKFTEMFLVPHLAMLCQDSNWSVRKSACDAFVAVAECASPTVRKTELALLYMMLISDISKWVSFTAYQNLGPFIALFADPTITGLELVDGHVRHVDSRESHNRTFTSEPDELDRYGILPKGTKLVIRQRDYEAHRKREEAAVKEVAEAKERAKRGERVMDSVISGINKMLSPFERSSPSQNGDGKRSPLSLKGAVSLMDKWSRRGQQKSIESSDASSPPPPPPPLADGIAAKRLGALPSSPKRVSPKKAMKATRREFVFDSPTSPTSPPPSDDENRERDDERQQYMSTSTPGFNEEEHVAISDDEDDLNQSFVERDVEQSKEEREKSDELDENQFSSLSYWNADCGIECGLFGLLENVNVVCSCAVDELQPFGSSPPSRPYVSTSYLESRLDVTKVRSPRSRNHSLGSSSSPSSSLRSSPRRHTTETATLNTDEKEKLGILDIDEMSMSSTSSSSSDDDDVAVTSPTVNSDVYRHVPRDLVEYYIRVVSPMSGACAPSAAADPALCLDVYRHCAFNFPAVCFTLGKAAWPRLRGVFVKLSQDEQPKVRQSIAYSIHDVATIIGQEHTDVDLLPVFFALRVDQCSDVRKGILSNMFEFVKMLSDEKRAEIILSLPQFFPVGAQPGNQSQNSDWRSRFLLISQLSKLCQLYSVNDINVHMSGIALTLADDRVAEVRREAVKFVSTIVGVLVAHEWREICERRGLDATTTSTNEAIAKREEKGEPSSSKYLSEQFVDDIVTSFAKTQKWTRRQTFCFICHEMLEGGHCDLLQFNYFFAGTLRKLINDKVANVRLAACDAAHQWKRVGESCAILEQLVDDDDIDVSFAARTFSGMTSAESPIDIGPRTTKMREREEKFFGDLVVTYEGGGVKRIFGHGDQRKEVWVKQPEEPKAAIVEASPNTSQSDALSTFQAPLETCTTSDEAFNTTLVDNTDEVDMEVDEPDEQPTVDASSPSLAHDEAAAIAKNSDDETIPADPAPTAEMEELDDSSEA